MDMDASDVSRAAMGTKPAQKVLNQDRGFQELQFFVSIRKDFRILKIAVPRLRKWLMYFIQFLSALTNIFTFDIHDSTEVSLSCVVSHYPGNPIDVWRRFAKYMRALTILHSKTHYELE